MTVFLRLGAVMGSLNVKMPVMKRAALCAQSPSSSARVASALTVSFSAMEKQIVRIAQMKRNVKVLIFPAHERNWKIDLEMKRKRNSGNFLNNLDIRISNNENLFRMNCLF